MRTERSTERGKEKRGRSNKEKDRGREIGRQRETSTYRNNAREKKTERAR